MDFLKKWKHIRNSPIGLLVVAGVGIGFIAAFLTSQGNPANMGICTACFWRDIVGALGLHQQAPMQYLRPEIFAIIAGAFLASFGNKQNSTISLDCSAPIIRFLLGFFVMIGALMFMGCPTRLLLRLAGGDFNALSGLVGFVIGIYAGTTCIQNGFSLGKIQQSDQQLSKLIFPLISIAFLLICLFMPSIFYFSSKGIGSMHAPVGISIIAGIIIGIYGFQSRFCFVGGFRDLILFKSATLLYGVIALVITAFFAKWYMGQIHIGFENQPFAHSDYLWNGLGMALVGFASVLLNGCPFRQLILAATGDSNALIAILGMLFGAAIAHNFAMAASPSGPTFNGMIAVSVGFAFCAVIGFFWKEK